ncbi:hypothetical protein I6I10_06905 [Corynebacterium glucuronolyticum]|uniref:Uncharacterized protein n=1 Tax=Corynebacterium glucuronolyticum TaxID=39791 RepID=A0A7T4EHR7_9CORY|nr:hypothetical protein [Corynebacterium glucuronolyticum]QQB45339.1 hypothetical protein I6I10_07275 [Corynebacterium glucuronolyticum]QQB47591.1 hypothetical protein I6I10_06905 [Corynebacterium glucuronolyticum]WKD64046.1 hypothetical protein CGLUCO_09005 [Corynebacterium glucuronolyticum DSM 44120]SMB82294.1 hypothetical protein SAMN05660745_02617 [Corynebacterium glucuronolyticum]
MPAFTARIPSRWAQREHPKLWTANPKQILLVIAPTRNRAIQELSAHAGPSRGTHWDDLQPASRGALAQLLKEPDVHGISHILMSGRNPINLNA